MTFTRLLRAALLLSPAVVVTACGSSQLDTMEAQIADIQRQVLIGIDVDNVCIADAVQDRGELVIPGITVVNHCDLCLIRF